MSLDKEKFAAIANLARLEIDEAHLPEMLNDFNKIMDYVDQVKELDTSSVTEEDMFEFFGNITRPDKNTGSLSRDDIAKIAPKFENGYVVVPRVIET